MLTEPEPIRAILESMGLPSTPPVPARAKEGHAVARFIGPLREHGSSVFSYGLSIDKRNDTVSASRGMYHSLRLDWAPGGAHFMPYSFWRLDGALRFYAPLGRDGSALAFRAVGDFLFGDPPVYELSRYDQTSAVGGGKGVRGVPAGRYAGKVKLFGNAELRTYLFSFHMLSKINRFGFVLFADAGRVFADYRSRPELDGTGLGLKYGLGAGLRLIGGESFVLRADVAWSPDAAPVGAYLASGQTF